MDLGEFLLNLFTKLAGENVRYCVLRNYEGLPHAKSGRDIDMAVCHSDLAKFENIIARESHVKLEYKIVKHVSCMYFLSGLYESKVAKTLEIDVVWDFAWRGKVYYDFDKIISSAVKQCVMDRHVMVPDEIEGACQLAVGSLLRYGAVPTKYQERILEIFRSNPDPVLQSLSHSVGMKSAVLISQSVQSRGCALNRLDRTGIYFRLKINSQMASSSWISIIRQIADDVMRPILRNRVLLVAFVGPDGAGKSTLIDGLVHMTRGLVVCQDVRHLKLKLWLMRRRVEKRGVVTDPHAKPPRGSFMSVLKVVSWAFSERFAWLVESRRDSKIVIMDRYFDDLIADPLRYRYGGPAWVVKALTYIVPRPSITFVLTASSDVILSRKQEVERLELEKMLKKYSEIKNPGGDLVHIDCDVEPIEIQHRVFECIRGRVGCWSY